MINVLSLFDGMSCGRIALDRVGIDIDTYYSSEIDKYAIKVSEANYPDIIRLGDVTNWRSWDIDWGSIDLVLAGFPCQAWSVAGKQLGDKDERGMLFWVMLDIMKHLRSLNPNLKFLIENVKMKKEFEEYITHHTEEALGRCEKTLINSALVSAQNRQRYYWCNWNVGQPVDKGIVLADIVESDFVDRDKAHCLDANYFKGGNLKSYFEKNRRQLVFINQRPRGKNKGGPKALDGKTPTLSANAWEHNNHLTDGVKYRKLTPIECERLQTLPDNFTNHVSNTQRYKMLGNGWTVDVITHILRELQNNGGDDEGVVEVMAEQWG